ncbi:MAG TPA: sulfite exporter TauE/SafE family protein [Allosphingosinicella sp.]|nr:sulfite exporter TauE/SafE family protein [Allosphingosinicella sp.]
MISPLELFLLFLAAIGAGFFNALAGGGSIFTFPVLIAVGVPPVTANVTNTVALCPGYFGGVIAQRRDLANQEGRMLALLPVAVLGGIVGAWLLTRTSDAAFRNLVPFLVLGACLLLALQDRIRTLLQRRAARVGLAWAVLPVFLAAIYGGYFGVALSVMFLAMLGLTIDDTLTRLNALKQAMSLACNIAAALYFAIGATVVWSAAGAMAAGALLGGWAGGRLASRVNAATLRIVVIAIGLIIAAMFALGW